MDHHPILVLYMGMTAKNGGYLRVDWRFGDMWNLQVHNDKPEREVDTKVMFGNSFYFLFFKNLFLGIYIKKNFLYFLNQKNVWLVEKKKVFEEKK